MWECVAKPIVVPDQCETLQDAICMASSMQTIIIRAGTHSLTVGRMLPTRVDKELNIVGQPGAVLEGGLHMGMGSSGTLSNIKIRGHLWVYGLFCFHV